MKMNRLSVLVAGAAIMLAVASCKKEECHECHYELNGQEVDLGKKCGDDLKNLESGGYTVDGTVYDVHCHEH